jgi:PadR family transcriptional regulator PadR
MAAKTSRKGRHYRHTPAFILLLLAQSDDYGSSLLERLENELPDYKTDSAVIYRTLQELEKTGTVTSYWEHTQSGPPRKWYSITEAGYRQLKEYHKDIEMRLKNLRYFLQVYDTLLNTSVKKK